MLIFWPWQHYRVARQKSDTTGIELLNHALPRASAPPHYATCWPRCISSSFMLTLFSVSRSILIELFIFPPTSSIVPCNSMRIKFWGIQLANRQNGEFSMTGDPPQQVPLVSTLTQCILEDSQGIQSYHVLNTMTNLMSRRKCIRGFIAVCRASRLIFGQA